MRILHVNNIANVGPALVEGLQRLGQEATFRDLKRIGKNFIYPVKLLLSPLRLLEYASLTSFIHSQSIDIVHIHYASQGLAGLLGRFPYLLHVHGNDVNQNLKIPLISTITRMALKRAEMVFYSTPNLEPVLRPIRNDAVFLPNPILLKNVISEDVNEPGETRVLLFMRLDPIKIDKTYLSSLAQLSDERGLNISAIRWGKMVGIVEREYPTIELVPMRSHSEINSLLNQYDIIIGQQIQGAIGMSELEAMAAGKPVIANYRFPDVYPEPPPVLAARNVDELTTTLLDLIRNPEKCRRLGKLGRKWVSTYHGLEEISLRLLEHYQHILSQRDLHRTS